MISFHLVIYIGEEGPGINGNQLTHCFLVCVHTSSKPKDLTFFSALVTVYGMYMWCVCPLNVRGQWHLYVAWIFFLMMSYGPEGFFQVFINICIYLSEK